jgi:hypothetical protein
VPSAPWDLIERLDAAALDSHNVHNDACQSFTEGESLPCSCGIPALLSDAAQFVRSLAVEAVVSRARRAA